jgi:hypothetical protein
MSHFYITLPCDASLDIHPSNTSSKFVTELPHVIDLQGEWEVALSEIIIPGIWNNVLARDYWFEVNGIRYPMLDGRYEKIYDVLKVMADRINRMGLSTAVVWTPHKVALGPHDYNIVMYVVGYNQVFMGLSGHHTRMSFSPSLGAMMRLRRLEYTSPNIIDSLGPARLFRPSIAYVYIDIVEPITVGDAKAQLLRMVFLGQKPKDDLHITYASPVYLPLKTKHFGSVEVNIMTDASKSRPFKTEKSLLLLHFKRTSL